MKPIKARIDFTLRGKKYLKGEEVKINSKEELIRLNERGFIEPFSYAEIQEYEEAKEYEDNINEISTEEISEDNKKNKNKEEGKK